MPKEDNVFYREPGGFASALIDTVKFRLQLPHEPLADLADRNPNMRRNGGRITVQSRFAGVWANIWSPADNQSLLIEASAPKFLTGQNVFGILKLRRSVRELALAVLRRAHLEPTEEVLDDLSGGYVDLLRVDVAAHVPCQLSDQARDVMLALRRLAVTADNDWSAICDQTVTLGAHSGRRTFKMYRKDLELAARPLGPRVWRSAHVEEAARNLIRFELSLRRKELVDHGMGQVSDCRNGRLFAQLTHRYRRVVRQLQGLPSRFPEFDGSDSLSTQLRLRLKLWKLGDADAFDVASSTRREYRRQILEATGLDIESPLPDDEQGDALLTLRDVLPDKPSRVCHLAIWEQMKAGH